MCSNPEMIRLLRDELREEFAVRRRARSARPTEGQRLFGWRPATFMLAVPFAALAALAVLWL